MSISEFRKRLRALHPIIKGAIFTTLASLIFFIEQWLAKHAIDLKKEALAGYDLFNMDTRRGVLELILWAPLREEIEYRGPVWVAALIAGWLIKRDGHMKVKILSYGACAILLLVLNYFWAFGHGQYCYTIFAFGIVWGGAVIDTKKLHYSLILHSGANAIAVVGSSLIAHCST